MDKAVIVSAVRTPIGRYLGALREVTAYELGAVVLNEVIKRAGVSAEKIDEVIMGQSYQNGESVNIARMSLLKADWPVEIPGITLDRRCCSGLDAICFGAMKILSGQADIIVAGGVESMSRTEFYIPGEFIKWGVGGRTDPRWGFMAKGHGALSMWGIPFFDRIARARVMSQPIERFGELNSMMSWAEAAARNENISRQQADEWALRSHRKACEAIASGKFKQEIVPVTVPQVKGEPLVIDTDEPPRKDTSLEKLKRLPAVYTDGVCTAGNSSTENDGAAAVVLMSEAKCKELKISPMARIVSFAVSATDPTLTYPAVPVSVEKALKKAELSIHQMHLIEIQEAFAVQVLADAKLMGISGAELDAKVNVNGSGISLGHPISATGAMRMVTLLYEMKRRSVRYGLETICGGGGHGIAAVVERC
ncbi:MAG: thiolase family protein [Deltaproteobacteria bacterium]|nr:thiolase family protein [Deltaproteobacteria bacterium]MBW1962746.1 thiolase family protein [Deltaproteobacteria bacterium]MBW1994808.1 thiolase family protein [Deltaproteobacteria bacterium]MBW2150973.1 thiolase family protein [Deltaproteobacteria bacterium]